MIRKLFFFGLFFLPLLTIAQDSKQIDIKSKLKAIANGYYLAYNEHNVDNILRFYTESTVLIDVNLKNHELRGMDNFRKVADEAFNGSSKIYKNMHFNVKSMEQEGYKLIVKGIMENIQWNEGYLENWPFVSHLYFNEAGRIIKQEDYIEYPARIREEVLLYTGKSKN